MNNRMDPSRELEQNMKVVSALFSNLQNLTAGEMLEICKELNTFSERVKHIYMNAALSGRITETD